MPGPQWPPLVPGAVPAQAAPCRGSRHRSHAPHCELRGTGWVCGRAAPAPRARLLRLECHPAKASHPPALAGVTPRCEHDDVAPCKRNSDKQHLPERHRTCWGWFRASLASQVSEAPLYTRELQFQDQRLQKGPPEPHLRFSVRPHAGRGRAGMSSSRGKFPPPAPSRSGPDAPFGLPRLYHAQAVVAFQPAWDSHCLTT